MSSFVITVAGVEHRLTPVQACDLISQLAAGLRSSDKGGRAIDEPRLFRKLDEAIRELSQTLSATQTPIAGHVGAWMAGYQTGKKEAEQCTRP